jgi:Putative bacterial sensory transduction regulator
MAQFIHRDMIATRAMMRFSVAAAAAAWLLAGGAAQAQSAGNDRVNARMVSIELRDMDLKAEVSKDSEGAPQVRTKVDDYTWVIFFFGCDSSGDLERRRCKSLQFYSSYLTDKPVSLETINQWNTDQRYARAYYRKQSDGKHSARIEVDALFEGTGVDPAAAFRLYFDIMKRQARQFRKHIDF